MMLLLHALQDAITITLMVRAVVDPGGGTTHAYSSLSSKLMVWVSAIRHHLQDTAPPYML
jgi:hypothetical protein